MLQKILVWNRCCSFGQ